MFEFMTLEQLLSGGQSSPNFASLVLSQHLPPLPVKPGLLQGSVTRGSRWVCPFPLPLSLWITPGPALLKFIVGFSPDAKFNPHFLLCSLLLLYKPRQNQVLQCPTLAEFPIKWDRSGLLWDTLALLSHSGDFSGSLGSSQESFHARRGCESQQSSLRSWHSPGSPRSSDVLMALPGPGQVLCVPRAVLPNLFHPSSSGGAGVPAGDYCLKHTALFLLHFPGQRGQWGRGVEQNSFSPLQIKYRHQAGPGCAHTRRGAQPFCRT